mmetsp:Transcript_474/g.617  ORF Transcript_474/g.617 Transcript_474/m.617 type:complete len:80 (-) Transcript_474:9-248(-)
MTAPTPDKRNTSLVHNSDRSAFLTSSSNFSGNTLSYSTWRGAPEAQPTLCPKHFKMSSTSVQVKNNVRIRTDMANKPTT